MRYNCERATSALTSFHFSECLCFSPKLLIVWNIFFSSFSLDCKQEIWMVGRQVRLRGDHNFSSWEKKKKNKKSFVRVDGRAFFVQNDAQ